MTFDKAKASFRVSKTRLSRGSISRKSDHWAAHAL